MQLKVLLILIPLLPLASFLIFGIFGKKYFKKLSGIISTGFLFVSCVFSLVISYNYFFVSGLNNGVYQTLVPLKFTWLEFSPGFSIDMGILLDPISVMMLVIVTFVSLMVHIYSIGYMKGEERYATFFAFLGLFTFSMLGLVISSNIFQIYVFWELVGVSSFLLIGYYYDRPSAVAACKKAFIVTRFADLGFLIGILILSFYAQTLDFRLLIERLTNPDSEYLLSAAAYYFMGASALTWGLVLIFIGGAGKSAMFPVHIWLPDAMEGPTPVSALIHAATMVVAGVFLVARLFPVFAISCPAGLDVVAFIGILSAAMAAVIACTQTDIKRVLAYSTMSQIGYMMFALGVAGWGSENILGYTASMFHLFTHAFFKALLFLGAGVVIHLVHSNELKDMGGLKKYLPVTHITFLIACLAIAGIPPFAGFFSKEEILLASYHHSKAIYTIGLITSGLTAFYMFRLYFGIFWNKPVELHPKHNGSHHGEGGITLIFPLILLAIGAVFSGFIPFSRFISADGIPFQTEFHFDFSILPVVIGFSGILIAMKMYKTKNELPERISISLKGIYQSAYRKFYVDELYVFITKKIIFNLIAKPAAWLDRNVVDGLMNLIGTASMTSAEGISGLQSGEVQQYAAVFFIGAIGLAVFFLYLFN